MLIRNFLHIQILLKKNLFMINLIYLIIINIKKINQ